MIDCELVYKTKWNIYQRYFYSANSMAHALQIMQAIKQERCITDGTLFVDYTRRNARLLHKALGGAR